jgi:hypothetical protein
MEYLGIKINASHTYLISAGKIRFVAMNKYRLDALHMAELTGVDLDDVDFVNRESVPLN